MSEMYMKIEIKSGKSGAIVVESSHADRIQILQSNFFSEINLIQVSNDDIPKLIEALQKLTHA